MCGYANVQMIEMKLYIHPFAHLHIGIFAHLKNYFAGILECISYSFNFEMRPFLNCMSLISDTESTAPLAVFHFWVYHRVTQCSLPSLLTTLSQSFISIFMSCISTIIGAIILPN